MTEPLTYKDFGYRSGEKTLTPKQVEQLLSCVHDLHDLALLKLAITTGIRREDIVKINTKDIDFEKGILSFHESKKKRIKTVPLMESTIKTLTMWIKLNKNPALFPPRKGKAKFLSSKTAYNIYAKYLKLAGLEPRPFHSLRATCVKLCQRAGWSPEQTAELLGDKVSTIQKHYSVPTPEELKEAAKEKPIL